MPASDNIRKILVIVAVILIVAVIGAIGYFALNYYNSRPDEIIGTWNGTVMYQEEYYESTFIFTNDSVCNMSLYQKPGMTYNLTRPYTEAIQKEQIRWEKENDHYNLIYPDGKVRLDKTDVSKTLRFSEKTQEGYKNPYIGYISKEYSVTSELTPLTGGK